MNRAELSNLCSRWFIVFLLALLLGIGLVVALCIRISHSMTLDPQVVLNGTLWNKTNEMDNGLVAPEDVTVDAVVTSAYFNAAVFVVLMASYEILRRVLPTVYSSRKRLTRMRRSSRRNLHHESEDDDDDDDSVHELPDDRPLDWIQPVVGVSWSMIRKVAGLDGYFFLRYIRMNVRITAVSTLWFFLILVPVYASGHGQVLGWYRISVSNVANDDNWRLWVAVLFAYLFTAFCIFVMQQEYRHYLELRQDFLARGLLTCSQHQYSLLIEGIPLELRSDRALYEYLDNLFPGRVHSATVCLQVPDVQAASDRCLRVCRRLEKSVATVHATGQRPTHIVGNSRLRVLGVDLEPWDCGANRYDSSGIEESTDSIDASYRQHKPERGSRVDSMVYYTHDLAAQSRALARLQRQKQRIANTGNTSLRASNWLDRLMQEINSQAVQIMDESYYDNDLLSPTDSFDSRGYVQAERMTSRYGSISPTSMPTERQGHIRRQRKALQSQDSNASNSSPAPFSRDTYRSVWRRWAGRLGLDFCVVIYRFLHKQLDVALEGVLTSTMSSTGFVTFGDLSAATCAASAQLSAKSSVLYTSVAPEPRDIRWENVHVSRAYQQRREITVNVCLALGVIFWSLPLAAIQVLANPKEKLSHLPGLSWLTNLNEPWIGLINGYLPVVALLGLIMILPVLFEFLATSVERRKTMSDIQASMLTRYFYFQVATIYITVTAGAIIDSLSDMIENPSQILALLGQSLPGMVGYFVALLMTKIMTGLPMIFLRFGALSRMLFLRLLSQEERLTQRELDAVYRLENVQYGWEFPTQLLVVVIVFTYAIMSPVILPVGFLYFAGALIVYKKQILYVYSPVYESGGSMFPIAVQRTIFGLIFGQLTFMGYIFTRLMRNDEDVSQTTVSLKFLSLVPLPILTIYAMNFFHHKYVLPSRYLSLERARERDRHRVKHQDEEGDDNDHFDKNAYRQPVLTKVATEPWFYRRGVEDAETLDVRATLREINAGIQSPPASFSASMSSNT